MEVPRNKRLQKWRYRLGVEMCSECGHVLNEVPTGVRDFIDRYGAPQPEQNAYIVIAQLAEPVNCE